MTDTVIPFEKATKPHRPFSPDTGFGLPGTQGTGSTGAARATVRGTGALAPIEIDKLYQAEGHSVSNVSAVLGLLAEAIALLDQARASLSNQNVIDADRYVQRFQVLLPDLFKKRNIGDGYALVINSLHFAFVNQHGRPLEFEQLTTVWRIMKELRNAPFLSFQLALSYVSELENCQLQVDPPVLADLIEELGDE